MKAILVCLFMVGMLIPSIGRAAGPSVMTLDECIDTALKTRASIIAARGQEDLAKANRRAALGAFLPYVSASYNYSKSKRRDIKIEQAVPSGYDTIRYEVDYEGEIFSGLAIQPTGYETRDFYLDDQDNTSKSWGANAGLSLINVSDWYNYAAAGAAQATAEVDVIASEMNLVYVVKVSYYAYLAAVENVSVQEDAVKRSEEQLKLIQSKFDLGSAARSDVLKQKVQFGNDKLSLLSAQNAAVTAKADLAYTIGIDPNSAVDFSTSFTPVEYSGSLDDATRYGLEHQPTVLAAQYNLDESGHYVSSAKAQYLPTLRGSGSLYWNEGTSGDTVTYDNSSRSLSYGVGVSWNIFDGFLRERNVSSAKINRNNAIASLAERRNLVTVEIKKAYLDIDVTQQQKSVAGENVEAATEDMKITQEKYNLGAATILDLLDAQVSLKSAQVDLIRADFDLNLSVAKLENAMGTRLE